MNKPIYIYAIINNKTGRRYIGSTINLRGRLSKHIKQLREERHHNQWLQRSWNKNGEENFSFAKLQELPKTTSWKERQLAEISEISKWKCFNNRLADEKFGNFKNSPATRKRISIGIQKMLIRNPGFGKTAGEFMKTEKGKKLARKALKLRWKDPKERKKLRSGLNKWWSKKENRKAHGEVISAARKDPKLRAIISQKSKEMWQDPEKRARQEAGAKKRWLDPARRAAQSARLKAAWARRKAKMVENKNTN